MIIRFNSQITSPVLSLTLEAKEIFEDGTISSTSAILESLIPTPNAPGIYDTPDLTVPQGRYYVHITNGSGMEAILFMRVFADSTYNLVSSPDDFGREPTKVEIDDQLNNKFRVE